MAIGFLMGTSGAVNRAKSLIEKEMHCLGH